MLLVGGVFGVFNSASVRRESVVFADDGSSATLENTDGESGATSSVKMVTIFDDGKKQMVQTSARTVGEVLKVMKIAVNEFDRVEPELLDFLENDLVVNIYRARPVVVRDGKIRTKAMSAARDARSVALSIGKILSEKDKVYFQKLGSADVLETGLGEEVVIERNNDADELALVVAKMSMEAALSVDFAAPTLTSAGGNDCTVGMSDNEFCVWQFLLGQGFGFAQVAGIMGNLAQEHHYRTDGDGLAQWTGGRKARLQTMENPTFLSTQLAFLMSELNSGYARVRDAILATDDVVEATRIFQNQFEKCGFCREDARIQYAYGVYYKYAQE
jgi:hypothetical protein